MLNLKIKPKIDFKYILQYATIFFICLVLANGDINGISPFLFAFYFAGLFVGLNEKLMAVFTMCGALVVDPSLSSLYIALTFVSCGLAVYYVYKLIKRKINFAMVYLTYLLAHVTYMFYNWHDIKAIVYYVLLGCVCFFVFVVVVQILLLRKNCFKLTLDESICFLFAVALIGVGLANIQLFNVQIFRFVLTLMMLIFIAVGSPTLTFALTLAFSLGVGLQQFSVLVVAEFALLALMGCMFSMPKRFYIISMILASDVFLQYYFFASDWQLVYAIVPVLLACLVFILLPKKLINNLSDFIYVKKSELSTRNLINNSRKSLRRRLGELSNVFMDMKQIHLNLVKKELSKEELIAMLTREVLTNCCKECLDKTHCSRAITSDGNSQLYHLIETAVTKGKITLLDIPATLTTRCARVNQLITLINRLSDEYKQYKNMLSDVNNVKILLADQMGAVARLLLDIGDEIDTNVSFDMARENKIISKLLSQNIQCNEVLLYNEKQKDTTVMLVIKGNSQEYEIIEKLVAEVVKIPMQIVQVSPMEEDGLTSIILTQRNRYDCVFGLASCNKAGNLESGDCHSIIRLGKDKFLLALCDGMGSGKSAHKMSSMTLGLIENFYKVGFDNEIVLESVNKLLAINNQENYSTLDVCLLDLNQDTADIIKVGAPFGVVKHKENIELIEGGALPIGALDSIAPATYKVHISTQDLIIMATDGVTDAFDGADNFIEYVTHLVSTNPQTIAENILNEALRLNNMEAKDDMTILVARTYLKNLKQK